MRNNLQIAIKSPCNERWDDMQPVVGGRHCNRCAKTVVDFASMTEDEILDQLTRADWSQGICIQATRSQLAAPVISTMMPRLAAATLVALLGLASPEAKAYSPFSAPVYETTVANIFRDTAVDNKLAFGAKSDDIIIVVDGEVYNNDIESIDRSVVESFEWILSPMNGFCAGNRDVLSITTRKVEILPAVEVVARCEKYLRGGGSFSYPAHRPWKASLVKRSLPVSSIKAFPNPCQRGREISVTCDAATEQVLIVTDMQGRIIHATRAIPQSGIIRLAIPSYWSAGTYILSLSEKGENPQGVRILVK